jgi:hypothetical protein
MANEKGHPIKVPRRAAADEVRQHCERDDGGDIREDTP